MQCASSKNKGLESTYMQQWNEKGKLNSCVDVLEKIDHPRQVFADQLIVNRKHIKIVLNQEKKQWFSCTFN